MSAIKLTVGIPTYNRAGMIRCALDSVLKQIDDRFRHRLEILISDNASTDQTQEIVREYSACNPGFITCLKNASNIGYSRNVDAVIRHARGEFVFLLSDDDAFESDTLATIFSILEQYKNLGAIFLAETPYDCNLRIPLRQVSTIKGGTYFTSGVDFVEQMLYPPALVSGYVIRREAWINANPDEYFDTLIVHSLTVLRIFLKQSSYSVYFSQTPSIRYRTEGYGCTCSYDELYPFVFFLDLLYGCRSIRSFCPRNIYIKLHQQAMRSIAYHIMDQKLSGNRINTSLLSKRLRALSDPTDPLYWLNQFFLRLPRWSLRIPFRMALKFQSTMRRGHTMRSVQLKERGNSKVSHPSDEQ